MLIKTDDITTETYWIRDGYLVDIQITPEYFDAYIYEANSGVKRQMFGFQRDKITYPEYIYKIEEEAEFYIRIYEERMAEEMFLDDLLYDEDEDFLDDDEEDDFLV